MDRIGIGILGGGGVAAEGHLSGYLMDPRCAVRALWDVDEAKARAQARTQVKLLATLQAAVGAAPMDVLQHLVGVDEEHVKALPARFVGERLRQVRLSHTARPAD